MLQCELLCVPTSGSGFYQWVWILLVGLDFTSGSGFYQWVWILPVGLDFISGSGFCQWVWILPVGLDMITPWARLPGVSCGATIYIFVVFNVYTQPWHNVQDTPSSPPPHPTQPNNDSYSMSLFFLTGLLYCICCS